MEIVVSSLPETATCVDCPKPLTLRIQIESHANMAQAVRVRLAPSTELSDQTIGFPASVVIPTLASMEGLAASQKPFFQGLFLLSAIRIIMANSAKSVL